MTKKEKKITINDKEWQNYLTETAYNQGVRDTIHSVRKKIKKLKVILDIFLEADENGFWLENKKGEIIVDGRPKYCKECGGIKTPPDYWILLNELTRRLSQVKELFKTELYEEKTKEN